VYKGKSGSDSGGLVTCSIVVKAIYTIVGTLGDARYRTRCSACVGCGHVALVKLHCAPDGARLTQSPGLSPALEGPMIGQWRTRSCRVNDMSGVHGDVMVLMCIVECDVMAVAESLADSSCLLPKPMAYHHQQSPICHPLLLPWP
jgi:hypothetical protein